MNVNTTTATLTQNDLNRLAADEQDFIRYQDLVLLAEKNGLSVEDALFYAEEHVGDAIAEAVEKGRF
jgi:hypothetical protein